MAKKDKKAKNQATGGSGRVSCMLLSSASALLGRGILKSKPEDKEILVTMTSGDPYAIPSSEVLQIVPTVGGLPPLVGRLVSSRDDDLTLEHLRGIGAAMRKSFRMPVDFESFFYYKAGGRAPVRALNLSCGGVAVCSAAKLEVGEVCEIVIPITSEGPLILDCEILRSQPYGGPIQSYAAKFVDLIPDQEAMLQEAVFQTQMDSLTAKPAR